MLKVGTMVALNSYNQSYRRPIGIVVGHDMIFNNVKWINKENHHQDDGGYMDISLEVLSEVK